MREKFWALFQEIKFSEYYYIEFQKRADFYRKIVTGTSLFASAVSIYSWSIWGQYPVLWAVIIAVSQIVQTFKPLMKYPEQLSALKYAIPNLKLLSENLANDWNEYCPLKIATEEKCRELYTQYASSYRELLQRYSLDDLVPDSRTRIKAKAEKRYDYYFRVYHKITEWSDLNGNKELPA